MKSIKSIAIVIALVLGIAVPAQAQFRFGVKAGVNVSNLHLDDLAGGNLANTFSSDNQAGFTGGVMAEFTVPVIGVGLDVSAMYVRRNAKFMEEQNVIENHRDYFEIPVNLKWKIGIPVIQNYIQPYIFTGPSFAFLTSKRAFEDAYRNKQFDTSWNVGLGLQLVKHVQIGASYGFGLTKALKTVGTTGEAGIEGKNNYWTVTAAYLF